MQRTKVVRRWWIGLAVIAVVASMLPGAQAAAPASTQAPQSWVASGHGSHNWSYGNTYVNFSGNSSWSWSETITATNTSANVTQIESDFVTTYTSSSTFCAPDCSTPTYVANYSETSSAERASFLNLTTNATVYENGSAAAALGAINGSVTSVRALQENFSCQANHVTWGWACGWGNRSGGNRSFSTALTGSVYASAQLAFTPPLGLIPWNVSANLTWNSTSAYAATGGWNDSFQWQSTSSNGTTHTRGWNWNGSINRSGNESAQGRDIGNVTGPNNTTVQGIRLHVGGRFGFDSDLFPTIIGSDLFNNATANWTIARGFGGDDVAEIFEKVLSEHRALAPGASSGGTGSSSGSRDGSSAGGGSGVPPATVSTPPAGTPGGTSVPPPSTSPPSTPGQLPGAPSSTPRSSASGFGGFLGGLPWMGIALGAVVVAIAGVGSAARRRRTP